MHALFAFHLLPTMAGIYCRDNVLQLERAVYQPDKEESRKLTQNITKMDEPPVDSVGFRPTLRETSSIFKRKKEAL